MDANDDLQPIAERFELWTGLAIDRQLLEEAAFTSSELADALQDDDVDIYGLRDAVANILIGAEWSEEAPFQPRIREAARARGIAYLTPDERVDLGRIDVEDMKRTMRRWYLLEVSDALIRDVLVDNPDLYADLIECGGHTETMTREMFVSGATRLVIGRDWPVYAEGEAVKNAFHAALDAGQRPGYLNYCADPAALVALARLRLDRDDVTGAREHLDAAVLADPDVKGTAALRIELDVAQGHVERALSAADSLVDADNKDPLRRVIRAEARAAARRYAEAKEDLLFALERLGTEGGAPARAWTERAQKLLDRLKTD